MYLKICPVCGKESYGASPEKQWICPYCFTDISEEETKIANLKME